MSSRETITPSTSAAMTRTELLSLVQILSMLKYTDLAPSHRHYLELILERYHQGEL